MVIPCLHPSTPGRRLDLPEYLAVAQEAGFSLVDWDAGDILGRVERDGLEAVKRLFSDHRVSWAGFGVPTDLFADEATFQASLERVARVGHVAHQFHATRAMTWLWPSIDEPPVAVALQIVRRARQVADLLAQSEVQLGLEFVGPHHLRNKKYPLLHSLTDMLALIDAIDRPNVGVLLDSYHWYTSESSLEELQTLPVAKVVEVHINDATKSPPEAHDQDRVLPGEGQIPLKTFLSYLGKGGYEGPLSLEILRQRPPEDPPSVVARRALEGLSRLIEQASH